MRSYVKRSNSLEILQTHTKVFPDMTTASSSVIEDREIFIVENSGMYIRISGTNVLIFASAPSAGVVGEIRTYCASTPPTNDWLMCDGSQFDTTLCPELYNVLGSDHVPDLREYTTKMGSNIGQFNESAIGSHSHTATITHGHDVVYTSSHPRSYGFLNKVYGGLPGSYSLSYENFQTVICNQYGDYSYGTQSYNSQVGQYSWIPSTAIPIKASSGYWPNLVRTADASGSSSGINSDVLFFNVRFGSNSYDDNGITYNYQYNYDGTSGSTWSSTQLKTVSHGGLDQYWKPEYPYGYNLYNAQINLETANTTNDVITSGVNAEVGSGVYYIIRAK